MKANRAPDKLYLSRNIYSTYLYQVPDPDDDTAVEYVRTDAFIEKACSWLKENKDKYLYNTGEKGEYIPTCSSKMIEEFRTYMKGE